MSTYKGVKHIDGGFSDNLPVFDEHTIRICCFSGASDISPYDRAKMELLSVSLIGMPVYLNFGNCRRAKKALFPPPVSYIIELLERGFHDTKDFILSNDLIQCDSCYRKTDLRDQPIFQKLSPTITPSVSPAISRTCSFRDLANLSPPLDDISEEIQSRTRSSSDEEQEKVDNTNNEEESSDNNNKQKRLKLPKRAFLSPNDHKKGRNSFTSLLREKLSSYSPDSGGSSAGSSQAGTPTPDQQSSMNYSAPVIVVEEIEKKPQVLVENTQVVKENQEQINDSGTELNNDDNSLTDDSTSSSSAAESKRKKPAPESSSGSPQTQPRLGRRKTIQQENSLFVVPDRFTALQNPSCPPSPNLNRHCSECIRLRQEARLDAVEEELMQEAEKYRSQSDREKVVETGGFRSKLASPLRWLRQIGTKTSYKFEAGPTLPTLAK